MSAQHRMRRVNELLLRELAILCEELVVPHMDALVTITEVSTSHDLRHAKVFVSVMGSDKQRARAMAMLENQRVPMQDQINRRLSLKYTPRLHFREDHTPERADRILSILEELDLPEDDQKDGPDRR